MEDPEDSVEEIEAEIQLYQVHSLRYFEQVGGEGVVEVMMYLVLPTSQVVLDNLRVRGLEVVAEVEQVMV